MESYRTNLEKEPWKSQPSWSTTLPSRHVFNVHLGSTIIPFGLLAPQRAVLPINGRELMSEEQISNTDNGLRDWWRNAERMWEANKTKQSPPSLMKRINYHRGLETQLDPVKHRVVYSLSGNTLAAARLDDPQSIIEQTLLWIPTSGLSEARYLTAVLNAPITTELVSVYQSRGLFGARHFSKDVWRLPIPKYNQANPLHATLVDLATKSEEIAAGVDAGPYGFQKHRSLVREALTEAGITEPLDKAVKALLGED